MLWTGFVQRILEASRLHIGKQQGEVDPEIVPGVLLFGALRNEMVEFLNGRDNLITFVEKNYFYSFSLTSS